ncbi:MinD/ParA family protein [Halomicroarcula sp. GCM10025710]
MGVSTLALVGATGGAGTTTVAVELAATLARAGRSVTVVDAAFATQGLSTYVSGRIDGDVTAVATGEIPVEEALYDLGLGTDGQVLAVPAHAPFERLARAKAPEHAQRLESMVADLGDRVDHVLLDVPPVAANQAVAAVTTADRRALVAPATQRGPTCSRDSGVACTTSTRRQTTWSRRGPTPTAQSLSKTLTTTCRSPPTGGRTGRAEPGDRLRASRGRTGRGDA